MHCLPLPSKVRGQVHLWRTPVEALHSTVPGSPKLALGLASASLPSFCLAGCFWLPWVAALLHAQTLLATHSTAPQSTGIHDSLPSADTPPRTRPPSNARRLCSPAPEQMPPALPHALLSPPDRPAVSFASLTGEAPLTMALWPSTSPTRELAPAFVPLQASSDWAAPLTYQPRPPALSRRNIGVAAWPHAPLFPRPRCREAPAPRAPRAVTELTPPPAAPAPSCLLPKLSPSLGPYQSRPRHRPPPPLTPRIYPSHSTVCTLWALLGASTPGPLPPHKRNAPNYTAARSTSLQGLGQRSYRESVSI
jgi:hypothetical protein